MLPITDDWRAVPSQGGTLLRWASAVEAGWVQYVESRPLQPLHAQVHDQLGIDPDFAVEAASPIFRFQTQEGEYGAGLIVDGRSQKTRAPQRRIFCSVMADHFCTWLVAHLLQPSRYAELGDRVIRLAASDRLWLGLRRRRFVFAPPAGWRLRAMGLSAWLLHPAFPRRRVSIVVPPAWPLADDTPGLDAWLREQDSHEALSVEPEPEYRIQARTSARGLQGFLREGLVRDSRDGERRLRIAVSLRDERYLYGLRLIAPADEPVHPHVELLLALSDSIEPLPGGQASEPVTPGPASVPPPGGVMMHWSG